jgi:hypothetical protein
MGAHRMVVFVAYDPKIHPDGILKWMYPVGEIEKCLARTWAADGNYLIISPVLCLFRCLLIFTLECVYSSHLDEG